MIFDPSGKYVYIPNNGSNTISMYSFNSSSGILTPLSESTVATQNRPSGIIFDPSGNYVYILNNGSNSNIYVWF